MTDFLSQDDIDNLLNSNFGVEEDSSGKPSKSDDPDSEIKSPNQKVFKLKKSPRPSFDYPYQSPVFKKDQFVVDPEQDKIKSANKPVVWTLQGYTMFKPKKKNLNNK